MAETVLVPSEPVTVVLSQKGWVRSAKGHDIDPTTLSYKAGDGFMAAVRGKSTQLAVFLDTTGRTYALPAHTLPSARGQGEPLTGRLSPPEGASFIAVMLGDAEDLCLLASDAGYGFVVSLGDLYARQRAGKVVLTLPEGARVLPPVAVRDIETAVLATTSSTGRLLLFPLQQLPRLTKGKGFKLMGIPAAHASARQDYVAALACLPRPAVGSDLWTAPSYSQTGRPGALYRSAWSARSAAAGLSTGGSHEHKRQRAGQL